jgi:hypothetical protein
MHQEKTCRYRSLSAAGLLAALALLVAGCLEDRMLGVIGDGGHGGQGGGNPPGTSGACAVRGDSDACHALPGCRWLEPGCGSPALPRATCAPVAELNCRLDANCPTGKRCLAYSTHPCAGPTLPGQVTCAACGEQTMICW